jgi:hypothetical protein
MSRSPAPSPGGPAVTLTDRRRIIPVTINMMSRKRFARLHVGFVNIHADRIRCEVVAASRV